MVDLKYRIVKPRTVRGTPSYAFINKLCAGMLLGTSVIGICIGYFMYARDTSREDYGQLTWDKCYQDNLEERVRIHVANRKIAIKALEKEEKEEKLYYPERKN